MADDLRPARTADTTGGDGADPPFDVVIEGQDTAGGEEGGESSRHDRLSRRADEAKQRDRASSMDAIGPHLQQLTRHVQTLGHRLDERDLAEQEREKARKRSDDIATAEDELAKAREAYRSAFDSGESDAATEAQVRISRATSKIDRLKEEQARVDREREEAQARPAKPAEPEPKRAAAPANPRLEQFMGRYGELYRPGTDTRAAIQRIDQELQHQFPKGAGYGTAAYWDELERRVDSEVARPAAPPRRDPAHPTVSGGRGGNGGSVSGTGARQPTRVKLSADQAATASRLGIPVEAYARSVHEARQRGEIA